MKRIFDLIVAFFGLVFTVPLFLIIVFLIKSDSPGPIFYRAQRAGHFGKPFTMFKFRTMVINADKIGGPSTSADDPRLTKIGRKLRKYKLDELPQLINVFKGEMSIVGPRPEVVSEIDTYDPLIKEKILSVKPGMGDLATLSDLNEEEILRGSADPHQTYREKIKPEKIRLNLEYVEKQSFSFDLKIIISIILKIFSK